MESAAPAVPVDADVEADVDVDAEADAEADVDMDGELDNGAGSADFMRLALPALRVCALPKACVPARQLLLPGQGGRRKSKSRS